MGAVFDAGDPSFAVAQSGSCQVHGASLGFRVTASGVGFDWPPRPIGPGLWGHSAGDRWDGACGGPSPRLGCTFRNRFVLLLGVLRDSPEWMGARRGCNSF